MNCTWAQGPWEGEEGREWEEEEGREREEEEGREREGEEGREKARKEKVFLSPANFCSHIFQFSRQHDKGLSFLGQSAHRE